LREAVGELRLSGIHAENLLSETGLRLVPERFELTMQKSL